MKKQMQKSSKVKQLIINNLKENFKEYIIVSLLFIIGVVLGTAFINQLNQDGKVELQNHLTGFINSINTDSNIDKTILLKSSLLKDIIFVVLLWFMGSTIIGIPVVCLIICAQGFVLGYTASSILITYGGLKGIFFLGISLFLQNIIFIPCIIVIAVSGIKIYKAILKDKRKENIKTEILRHTFFSLIMSLGLVASTFIETYISSNLVIISSKMFGN